MNRPDRPRRHWFWDDAWPVIRREALIATMVAGSLAIVLLARRWATLFLGQGILNQEIFAGSAVVNELVGHVEERVRAQEEANVRQQRRARRRTRAPKRGSTHGTNNNTPA